jgi:hypothetical protein
MKSLKSEEFVIQLPFKLCPIQEQELLQALTVRQGIIRIDIGITATGATQISIIHTGEDAGISQLVQKTCQRFVNSAQTG